MLKTVCTKCNESKDQSHFYVNPKTNRRQSWCVKCRRELERKRRLSRGITPKIFSEIKDGRKLCLNCNKFKLFIHFSPSYAGIGGLISYCKKCQRNRFRNRDRGRIHTASYRKRNHERYKSSNRIRQFKRIHLCEVTSDGTLTDDVLKEIYSEKFCHYCDEYTIKSNRTLDHKIPLSRGGSHSKNNVVMACNTCNCSKSDKTDVEFMLYLQETRK